MSQPATPDTTEFRQLPAPLAPPPAGLPEIPGGWTRKTWQLAGQTLSLVLPANPDSFLDDPEVIQAHETSQYMPYWAYLWPASLHMAAAVLKANWEPGLKTLELGAGVGMVGVAAGLAGLNVTFTDYDATSVNLCLYNANLNGQTQAQGRVIDWQHPQSERFPLILGCEILYENRNHDLLIPLLQQMLDHNGVAWIGDGGRARAERFCRMLSAAGFRYRLFDEEGIPLPLLRVGRYQLLEIRWDLSSAPNFSKEHGG